VTRAVPGLRSVLCTRSRKPNGSGLKLADPRKTGTRADRRSA
jgi:hypothetical protein